MVSLLCTNALIQSLPNLFNYLFCISHKSIKLSTTFDVCAYYPLLLRHIEIVLLPLFNVLSDMNSFFAFNVHMYCKVLVMRRWVRNTTLVMEGFVRGRFAFFLNQYLLIEDVFCAPDSRRVISICMHLKEIH